MPSNSTKYAVDVLLNPEDFPTEDKSVIWDNASGSFALGDAPGGGGGTTITQVESQTAHIFILGYDTDSNQFTIPVDFSSTSILVGELSARVNDNSRFQTARIVVGWTQEQDPSNLRISTVEDVRYPSQKVIFNINGLSPTVNVVTLPYGLIIYGTQYKMGTSTAQKVTYTFNYRVF